MSQRKRKQSIRKTSVWNWTTQWTNRFNMLICVIQPLLSWFLTSEIPDLPTGVLPHASLFTKPQRSYCRTPHGPTAALHVTWPSRWLNRLFFPTWNPALPYRQIGSEVWAAQMPTCHSLVVRYLSDTRCIVGVETLQQEVGGGKKLLLCVQEALLRTWA